MTRKTFKIALIDFRDAQKSALYGLMDFFELASGLSEAQKAVGLDPQILCFKEDAKAAGGEQFDAIICPPRLKEDRLEISEDQAQWLQTQHNRGALICSVCAGAFALAQAGLLEGRSATTHWQLGPILQGAYPGIKWDTDKILIDDGDIITAGGVMAWVDLGLHLIERFYSPAIMRQVARQFVVEPGNREQRYYSSFCPVYSHGDEAILKIQHYLQKSFGSAQPIEHLARRANLTERTFMRRFKRATGMTPVAYLQAIRIEKAREFLELSNRNVAQVAWDVGYVDAVAFRRLFTRTIGLTPQDYRKRFGIERPD